MALGIEKNTWEWYQAEYKKGKRTTLFLKDYIDARLNATAYPPSDKLKYELFMSYPASERYSKENQQKVIWGARYGNAFYKMLLKNRVKFTLLNNPKAEQGLVRTLIMMASYGKNKYLALEGIKKDFPKYYGMMKAFHDVDGFRMQRKPKEFLEGLFPLIEKYNADPKEHYVNIMSCSSDIENLSKDLAVKCLKYVKPEYIRESMFDYSAYPKLLWAAGRKVEAKKFLNSHKAYLEENRPKKKFAKSFVIIDEILNN